MNILMVGGGKGSWQVRGVQLGAALGARVTSRPKDEDFAWADVIVLVKRAGFAYAERVHAAGKPLVWDALDFWEQPEQNALSEAESRALLQEAVGRIRPSLTIGATEAMAQAAGGVYLPHHSWAYLNEPASPTTAQQMMVGYEGKRKYLGRFANTIDGECHRRGWQFVVNPLDLRDCDFMVSFRDGDWDGWMCREWKSGVKIVNAIAAGRPIVSGYSAAWVEIRPTGACGIGLGAIGKAFDWYSPNNRRPPELRAEQFTVGAVAERYRNIIKGVIAGAKAA